MDEKEKVLTFLGANQKIKKQNNCFDKIKLVILV